MTLQDFITNNNLSAHDNLVDNIWNSTFPVEEKIALSLEWNAINPSYHTLTTLWLRYNVSGQASRSSNEKIYAGYQCQLSISEQDLSGSTEYSLHFDIFEDPEKATHAWTYFTGNNPSRKFIKVMLANSGPVRSHLKYTFYEGLLNDVDYHFHIHISISRSRFDTTTEKFQARDILFKLNLDDQRNKINESGHPTFADVALYLKG
ncbi:hypothetical protein [Pseudochryseolinea flava]|uniref:Uncharacterized protein n=1 Tax=Pseudochryseolinea flava TaxID=2059302 RepID=A0A364XU10_9BACT|nr:hypothetical protein [Pseudochryseolinea flava]RAV97798.1 hypothetical protein DQQ10_26870 [Pseudochryseolinea flava]